MERIVNTDMSWLSERDQKSILTPLMLMRRYELEYRLTREEAGATLFREEYQKFTIAFSGIMAASTMRQTLIDQVKTYTDAFAEWMASAAKIARSNAIISAETRQMIPAADEIIASANDKATAAAAGVAASQEQTKLLIIGIGIAVIALGLIFNWLIGAASHGRFDSLAGAMQKLAAGRQQRWTFPRPTPRTRSARWRAP